MRLLLLCFLAASVVGTEWPQTLHDATFSNMSPLPGPWGIPTVSRFITLPQGNQIVLGGAVVDATYLFCTVETTNISQQSQIVMRNEDFIDWQWPPSPLGEPFSPNTSPCLTSGRYLYSAGGSRFWKIDKLGGVLLWNLTLPSNQAQGMTMDTSENFFVLLGQVGQPGPTLFIVTSASTVPLTTTLTFPQNVRLGRSILPITYNGSAVVLLDQCANDGSGCASVLFSVAYTLGAPLWNTTVGTYQRVSLAGVSASGLILVCVQGATLDDLFAYNSFSGVFVRKFPNAGCYQASTLSPNSAPSDTVITTRMDSTLLSVNLTTGFALWQQQWTPPADHGALLRNLLVAGPGGQQRIYATFSSVTGSERYIVVLAANTGAILAANLLPPPARLPTPTASHYVFQQPWLVPAHLSPGKLIVTGQTDILVLSCCSGHGTCLENGQCACDPGYYTPSCANFCTNTTCGLYGSCNSTGGCACAPGHTGRTCENACNPACVKGDCVQPQPSPALPFCRCQDKYFGEACDVFCSTEETCSSHGFCLSNGLCTCDYLWAGERCDVSVVMVLLFTAGGLLLCGGFYLYLKCSQAGPPSNLLEPLRKPPPKEALSVASPVGFLSRPVMPSSDFDGDEPLVGSEHSHYGATGALLGRSPFASVHFSGPLSGLSTGYKTQEEDSD